MAADLDDGLLDRPHYVFLGAGWAIGVAREAALKVQEAASAWSEAYPALEYRHGPIAAATENSVVWLLGVHDDALVADVRRTGATVVVADGDPQAELVLVQRVAVATAQAARAGSGPAPVPRPLCGAAPAGEHIAGPCARVPSTQAA